MQSSRCKQVDVTGRGHLAHPRRIMTAKQCVAICKYVPKTKAALFLYSV